MNTVSVDERFDFATRLVQEAGDLALGYFRRFDTLTVRSKGQQDMASEADLDTELLIRERLRVRFPEDAFFGEETGEPNSLRAKAFGWSILSTERSLSSAD
jgi:myo-inositol-1(or 4)-monophosphatase